MKVSASIDKYTYERLKRESEKSGHTISKTVRIIINSRFWFEDVIK